MEENNDIELENGTEPVEPLRPVLFAERFGMLESSYTIRRLLSGLVGSSHAAALVSSRRLELENVLAPTVEYVEYPVLKLPIFRTQNRRILLDRLARFKPTILHGFWPDHPELVAWASRQMQVPYILSFHQSVRKMSRLYLSARHAGALVAPFHYLADHLTRQWPQLSDRIRVIRPGCYVEDDCACFSEPNRKPSLVLIQPLNTLEELEPLLQAVRHLVLDGFEFALGIIGTGQAEAALRKRIRALGLTPVVTLVPTLRPLRSLLSGCDLFIHLNNSAAGTMALLEAMSIGVAVTGLGDPGGELLRDQETAALFDVEDEIHIYGVLKKLLTGRQWARGLALEAQEHLRRHHRVSRMLDELTALYHQVQESTRTPENSQAAGQP